MMSQVMVATRSQDYGSKIPVIRKETASSSEPPATTLSVSEPLKIKKTNPDFVIKPPAKGVLRKSSFNPHARDAQNYNIIEDLAISPLAISALEVLQSCPTQRKLILSTIKFFYHQDSNIMVFDLKNFVPRLPHQMAFQISVLVKSR